MRPDSSEPPHRPDATHTGRSYDPSFSNAEVSLLCCFGTDQFAERSHTALRAALLDAGLPGAAIRSIIRSSPMLERVSKGQYRIRPFRE